MPWIALVFLVKNFLRRDEKPSMLSHLCTTPEYSSSVRPFPSSFCKGRGYVEGKTGGKSAKKKTLLFSLD